MRNKVKVVQVRMDPILYDLVKKEAMKHQMSVSEYVRNVMITWFFAKDFIIDDIKEKLLEE